MAEFTADLSLIAPVIIPNHPKAQQRYASATLGYWRSDLNRLLKATFQLLLNDPHSDFTEEERQQLFSTTAHHGRIQPVF